MSAVLDLLNQPAYTPSIRRTARDVTAAMGGKWSENYGKFLCPVHREKTPSCQVSDGHTAPIFYCHGCGATGKDIIPALIELGVWEGRGRSYERRDVVREPVPEAPLIDWQPSIEKWQAGMSMRRLANFADEIGVNGRKLMELGIGWSNADSAWTFPMRNNDGRVVGIRTRYKNGRKCAIKGGASGMFIPMPALETDDIWIVEGPTDCAAALTLGFPAIGRPNCNSCVDMTLSYMQRSKAKRAIIVSDSDGPGRGGAHRLQAELAIPSVIWIPPAKDIRAFLVAGGDRDEALSMMRNLRWSRGAR